MQRNAAYGFFLALVGFAFTQPASAAAPAGDYPAKTIRYVIPFPPGGITDLMARTIAQEESKNSHVQGVFSIRLWELVRNAPWLAF